MVEQRISGGISNTEQRQLAILGVGAMEEQLYRWLLYNPRATVPHAARELRQTTGKVQRLLASIEAKGLVTRTPERPRRYLPVSPDIVLEAFALERQEDLHRARVAIHELQAEVVTAAVHDEEAQMVEVINSYEAQRQTFTQMHRSAREEVIALTRPPMLISRLDVPTEMDQQPQRDAQARGVRYRGIVDEAFLALPGAVPAVRDEVASGQDIRVTSKVPFKVIAADHRVAFIPLNLEQPGSPVLLVRSSALLDALYALFELLWEQATPIAFPRNGEWEAHESEASLPKGTEDLVSLLAAGLNDKHIAYELGISASTLNRRITEMMHLLNARSRFQLGWFADRRWAMDDEGR